MPEPWRPYLDVLVAGATAPEGAERAHVLLVRHSIREPITSAEVAGALATPLTEEGRALAREFGRRLDPARPLRLFHSPVPRCVETAGCIAHTAVARGGSVRIEGPRRFLGAPYLRDVSRSMAMFTDQGIRGFVEPWARGTLDPTIAQPPADAGLELLGKLLELRRDVPPDTLDIHVTHDLSVLTLLAPFTDIAHPGFPWPDYLDGAALHLHAGGRRLSHRSVDAVIEIPPRAPWRATDPSSPSPADER